MEKITHKPGSHREWNESYYYCFSDKKIHGLTRLGFKPNKEEATMFFLLFLPDESVAGYQVTEKIGQEWGQTGLNAGGMSFESREDGSWRFSFKGVMPRVLKPTDFPKAVRDPSLIAGVLPVSMDMVFTPIHDEYEYSEHMTPESLEIGKKAGDLHWEQVGLSNGAITVGKDVYAINRSMSQRDHTYGVRDWTGVGDWFYNVVWFDENLCVNPAAIIMEDGRVSWGGFILKDGKNHPIKEMKIREQTFIDDLIPVSLVVDLTTEEGKTYTLRGVTRDVVPIPFIKGNEMSILAQSFGEYSLDDITGGYGTFETLRMKKL